MKMAFLLSINRCWASAHSSSSTRVLQWTLEYEITFAIADFCIALLSMFSIAHLYKTMHRISWFYSC